MAEVTCNVCVILFQENENNPVFTKESTTKILSWPRWRVQILEEIFNVGEDEEMDSKLLHWLLPFTGFLTPKTLTARFGF